MMDNNFRLSITIEPLNYALKGHSVWLGLKYRQFEVGAFSFSIYSKTNTLFENGDQLDIKLQNGLAFYGRYYFQDRLSSPFVGFLLGGEKWRIRDQENTAENILKNAYITPQLGYQWVTLNGRLIINPNVRFIFPFQVEGERELNGIQYDLKNMGFIPALDLGVGFKL